MKILKEHEKLNQRADKEKITYYLFTEGSFTGCICVPKERGEELSYVFYLEEFMRGGEENNDLPLSPPWFSHLVLQAKDVIYKRDRLPLLYQ